MVTYESLTVWFASAAAILGIAILICSIVFVMRRDRSIASVIPIYIVFISLGSTFSACMFVSFMPHLDEGLRLARLICIIFLATASLLNVILLLGLLMWMLKKGGAKYDAFRRWYQKHKAITYTLLICSLTSFRFFTLIHSGYLSVASFSAPLPSSAIEVIDILGLVSVLLKDVPQIIVTIFISKHLGRWDTFAVLSLIFASLALILAIGCRVLMIRHLLDPNRMSNDWYFAEHMKMGRVFFRGTTRTGVTQTIYNATDNATSIPASQLALGYSPDNPAARSPIRTALAASSPMLQPNQPYGASPSLSAANNIAGSAITPLSHATASTGMFDDSQSRKAVSKRQRLSVVTSTRMPRVLNTLRNLQAFSSKGMDTVPEESGEGTGITDSGSQSTGYNGSAARRGLDDGYSPSLADRFLGLFSKSSKAGSMPAPHELYSVVAAPMKLPTHREAKSASRLGRKVGDENHDRKGMILTMSMAYEVTREKEKEREKEMRRLLDESQWSVCGTCSLPIVPKSTSPSGIHDPTNVLSSQSVSPVSSPNPGQEPLYVSEYLGDGASVAASASPRLLAPFLPGSGQTIQNQTLQATLLPANNNNNALNALNATRSNKSEREVINPLQIVREPIQPPSPLVLPGQTLHAMNQLQGLPTLQSSASQFPTQVCSCEVPAPIRPTLAAQNSSRGGPPTERPRGSMYHPLASNSSTLGREGSYYGVSNSNLLHSGSFSNNASQNFSFLTHKSFCETGREASFRNVGAASICETDETEGLDNLPGASTHSNSNTPGIRSAPQSRNGSGAPPPLPPLAPPGMHIAIPNSNAGANGNSNGPAGQNRYASPFSSPHFSSTTSQVLASRTHTPPVLPLAGLPYGMRTPDGAATPLATTPRVGASGGGVSGDQTPSSGNGTGRVSNAVPPLPPLPAARASAAPLPASNPVIGGVPAIGASNAPSLPPAIQRNLNQLSSPSLSVLQEIRIKGSQDLPGDSSASGATAGGAKGEQVPSSSVGTTKETAKPVPPRRPKVDLPVEASGGGIHIPSEDPYLLNPFK